MKNFKKICFAVIVLLISIINKNNIAFAADDYNDTFSGAYNLGTLNYKMVDDSGKWKFKGILLFAQRGIYNEYTNRQVKQFATELGSCAYIINSGTVYNWTCNNKPIIQETDINNLTIDKIGNKTQADLLNIKKDYKSFLANKGSKADIIYDYAESAIALANRIISYNSNARIYFTLPDIEYHALADCYFDEYSTLVKYFRTKMGTTKWGKNIEGFYIGTEAVVPYYTNFNINNQRDFDNPLLRLTKDLANEYFGKQKKLIWIPYIGADESASRHLERIGYVTDYCDLFDYVVVQSTAPFAEALANGNQTLINNYMSNIDIIAQSAACNRMKKADGSYVCPRKLYNTKIGFELEYSPADSLWRRGSSESAYNKCVNKIGTNKYNYPIIYYMGGPAEFNTSYPIVRNYYLS